MARLPSRRRHAAGFSLVEAMCASVVFLLGMAGLLGALIHARISTAQGRRQVRATAVAEDLVAQMQLWAYDDARLVSSAAPCVEDPTDSAGVLEGSGPDSEALLACLKAKGEPWLTQGGRVWGGLPQSDFPVGEEGWDRFQRYVVVREVSETGTLVPSGREHTGARKLIWVVVLYSEAGQLRKVTSQLVKPNPRAMTSALGGV